MITYRAPATLMILGEHAVLYGYPAIAASINQYVTVSLIQREDDQLYIDSSLGCYQSDLKHLTEDTRFKFILGAIKAFKPHLIKGLDIKVQSDFSSKIGFGSSAAVLASTLSCLQKFCVTNEDLVKIGIQIIQDIQTYGSGMDLITTFNGGVIYANPSKMEIERLSDQLPIHAIYSGYKTPTADVLKQIGFDPNRKVYKEISNLVEQAKSYIKISNVKALGDLFNQVQTHFKTLKVTCERTEQAIQFFKQQPNIYGSKISGSGLGDCVIGLGGIDTKLIKKIKAPQLYIPIEIESKGCHELFS